MSLVTKSVSSRVVALLLVCCVCQVTMPEQPDGNGTGHGGIDPADTGGSDSDHADPTVGTAGKLDLPHDSETTDTGRDADSRRGCDSLLFGSEVIPPNVLIVLDRSGSMNNMIADGTKWDIALSTIESLTQTHGDDARFGLMLFPGLDQPCEQGAICSPGAAFVDPAADTAVAITTFLDGANTCQFLTPIAENVQAVRDYAGPKDEQRDNYVLLVTDSIATCADPVPEVAALKQQDPSVRMFVVGFGSDVDPEQFAAMAEAGGGERLSRPRRPTTRPMMLRPYPMCSIRLPPRFFPASSPSIRFRPTPRSSTRFSAKIL